MTYRLTRDAQNERAYWVLRDNERIGWVRKQGSLPSVVRWYAYHYFTEGCMEPIGSARTRTEARWLVELARERAES